MALVHAKIYYHKESIPAVYRQHWHHCCPTVHCKCFPRHHSSTPLQHHSMYWWTIKTNTMVNRATYICECIKKKWHFTIIEKSCFCGIVHCNFTRIIHLGSVKNLPFLLDVFTYRTYQSNRTMVTGLSTSCICNSR